MAGWKISDIKGTITNYTFPKDTKITANGFLVLKRPDTKIMLNNDEDGLNLSTPDGKIINSVSYTKAPTNQSYNKISSGWAWSTTLTPGVKNIVTAATVKANSKSLPKIKNSVKNNGVEAGLADLSQNITSQDNIKTNNPWFLFFAVLAITIILALFVLFIKLKFQKNVRT